MSRILGALALAITAAMFIGCSSNDTPTSPNGGGGGTTRTIKADPSYATDIQEIFDRKGCTASNCHGSTQQSGLDLRTGTSYSQLVNVPVVQTSGTRVIPNDAQNSYLVIKVEGRQSVGTQMPQLGTALDSIDITNIRNWIDQGAKNN